MRAQEIDVKHFMKNVELVKKFKIDAHEVFDACEEENLIDELKFIRTNEEKAEQITRMITSVVLEGARNRLKTMRFVMNNEVEDQVAKIVLDQLGLKYTYSRAIPESSHKDLSSNMFIVTVARPIETDA